MSGHFHPVLGMVEEDPQAEEPGFHPALGHGEKP